MLIRLSQGQLNTLEACPRKFQHLYLDQLSVPVTPEQQEQMNWGSRFHLLMQQREMGIGDWQMISATAAPTPPNELALPRSQAEEIERHVAAFVQAAPELFTPEQTDFRGSEYRRSLEFQGFLLTVIYDLVIANAASAQILDWKTYSRPRDATALQQNWQTRLYPFVLAETSEFTPEQISMTYWFVRGRNRQSSDSHLLNSHAPNSHSPKPQYLHFPYSIALHEQTQADLSRLLQDLAGWLDRYEIGEDLPQVGESQGLCEDCPFAMRCQRGRVARGLQRFPRMEEIEEIVL